jgi:hypothetical protein
MRLIVGVLLLLGGTACSTAPPDSPGPVGELQVLFIGNSLTLTHDVPGLVQRISRVDAGPRVTAASVTFEGFSLEDHWNEGDALEAIDQGGWDIVVLQQGPSATAEHRAHLVEWTGRFAERIRASGAEPAMYMVWPGNGDFEPVIASYTAAAEAVAGELLPAGAAFRSTVANHPAIDLFEPDRLHPSLAGAYLAALTIYGALADRSVAGLTFRRPLAGVPGPTAETLEQEADRANGR